MRQGKTMAEIQHVMGLSYSTLHTYLPYTKVIYKMPEISQNAERVKAYKARKVAVDTLMAAPTEGIREEFLRRNRSEAMKVSMIATDLDEDEQVIQELVNRLPK